MATRVRIVTDSPAARMRLERALRDQPGIELAGEDAEADASLQAEETSADAAPEALTPREIEVLRLAAEGLANKQIAARLGISAHTVKYHLATIMGKLGTTSRTETVMAGLRRGLIWL